MMHIGLPHLINQLFHLSWMLPILPFALGMQDAGGGGDSGGGGSSGGGGVEGRDHDHDMSDLPRLVPPPKPLLPPAPAPAPSAPPSSAITDLANQYGYGGGGFRGMDIPGLPSGFVAGTTADGSVSEDPWTALGQAVSEDVPYLRSPLSKTTEGQAQRQIAIDPINAMYDQAKENLTEDLSKRGITPSSGIFIDEMGKLDEEHRKAIDEIDRQWAAGTTARLASSRDILDKLASEQEQRGLTAQEIESSLTADERQRLSDLWSVLTGQATASAGASQTGIDTALNALAQSNAMKSSQAGALGSGLGFLSTSLPFLFNQTPPQQTTPQWKNSWDLTSQSQPGDIYQTGESVPNWWSGGVPL